MDRPAPVADREGALDLLVSLGFGDARLTDRAIAKVDLEAEGMLALVEPGLALTQVGQVRLLAQRARAAGAAAVVFARAGFTQSTYCWSAGVDDVALYLLDPTGRARPADDSTRWWQSRVALERDREWTALLADARRFEPSVGRPLEASGWPGSWAALRQARLSVFDVAPEDQDLGIAIDRALERDGIVAAADPNRYTARYQGCLLPPVVGRFPALVQARLIAQDRGSALWVAPRSWQFRQITDACIAAAADDIIFIDRIDLRVADTPAGDDWLAFICGPHLQRTIVGTACWADGLEQFFDRDYVSGPLVAGALADLVAEASEHREAASPGQQPAWVDTGEMQDRHWRAGWTSLAELPPGCHRLIDVLGPPNRPLPTVELENLLAAALGLPPEGVWTTSAYGDDDSEEAGRDREQFLAWLSEVGRPPVLTVGDCAELLRSVGVLTVTGDPMGQPTWQYRPDPPAVWDVLPLTDEQRSSLLAAVAQPFDEIDAGAVLNVLRRIAWPAEPTDIGTTLGELARHLRRSVDHTRLMVAAMLRSCVVATETDPATATIDEPIRFAVEPDQLDPQQLSFSDEDPD